MTLKFKDKSGKTKFILKDYDTQPATIEDKKPEDPKTKEVKNANAT